MNKVRFSFIFFLLFEMIKFQLLQKMNENLKIINKCVFLFVLKNCNTYIYICICDMLCDVMWGG